MPHIKAKTLGWIAIYLAILPLFMIPEVVSASHLKASDNGTVATATHPVLSAMAPEAGK